MYRLIAVGWILVCLFGTPVLALEQEEPSLELLEFLGDWSVDDGWLDPAELEGMDLAEQERENDEKAQK